MLLFRSLTVGLLAACAYLLADLPAVHTHTIRTVDARPRVIEPPPNQVTVVDVAHGIDPLQIYELLRLREGETVVALGDEAVAAGDARFKVAVAVYEGARYLDLSVSLLGGRTRRVLVLLH
jgi:hypothetical protein